MKNDLRKPAVAPNIASKSENEQNDLSQPLLEKQPAYNELYLVPTRWNKFKVLLANSGEMSLLTLGLCLSVYQEDFFTLVYQFLLQVLLYFSMKEFGANVPFQIKFNKFIILCLIFLFIVKGYYLTEVGLMLFDATYKTWKITLEMFGFNFQQVQEEDGSITQHILLWESFTFEILAIVINLLLHYYYVGQNDRRLKKQPFEYVHNSLYLCQYKKMQQFFFFCLITDTFFCQNFIQLFVLELMLLIILLWALKSPLHDTAISICTKIFKTLINLELASYAITMLPYVRDLIREEPVLQGIFLNIGLLFNENALRMNKIGHTFLLCFTICSGQFFTASKLNFRALPQSLKDQYENFKQIKRDQAKADEEASKQAEKNFQSGVVSQSVVTAPRRSTLGKIAKIDYTGFIKQYMPLVCMWICRFCSFTISYAYNQYAGFVVLTWTLMSFVMKLEPFVKWTKRVYLPLFCAAFFYEYTINVQYLFKSAYGIFEDIPRYKIYTGGQKIAAPINPVEICGFVLNIIFMIVLIRYEQDIKESRFEFQTNLFEKMATERRNFLWQLSFFVLQKIHLILLFSIFLIGMDSINIFYIGLLYFFMKYVSSEASYRKSGSKLVIFTGFFIWIAYIWSLLKEDFYKEQCKGKDKNDECFDFIFKLMEMMTLQTSDNFKEQFEGADTFNSYMEVPIPFGQWVIILIFVIMKNINNLFKTNEYQKKKAERKRTSVKSSNLQEKDADFYQAHIQKILTKKFPFFAKIFIRVKVSIGETMNLAILIVQSLTLAFQEPNIMYWGFLIFSLVLQAIVISLTYGYTKAKIEDKDDGENDRVRVIDEEEQKKEEIKRFQRFTLLTKILKQYSGIVLMAQIAYELINNEKFLGAYGWGSTFKNTLEAWNIDERYMGMIGFYEYGSNQGGNIVWIFLSPIIFYITTSIMKDHFQGKAEALKNQQKLEAETLEMRATMRQQSIMIGSQKDQEKWDIEFEYEKVRFSVKYLIYQRIGQWKLMDTIALNFHLVTCFVTVFLCINWQISLFMLFQLFCSVYLCWKISYEMYRYGQQFKYDIQYRGLNDEKGEDLKKVPRNNIKFEVFQKEYITIDEAYKMNKNYKLEASERLMDIRQGIWYWQYWMLIASMILMYPTPLISEFGKVQQAAEATITQAKFWLFWTGIYVAPNNSSQLQSHGPMYILITILIFDKIMQGWQNNRYGCTLSKIREFKDLEEKIRLINMDKPPKKILDLLTPEERKAREKQQNRKKDILAIEQVTKDDTQFLTVMEARKECMRIEIEYREQSEEMRENLAKEELTLSLKRKYTNEFRYAIKFIIEQVALQLLLFSCANKSNIFSILYLSLLLVMIMIKKKSTAMRYIINAISASLILKYILVLTNLTFANSPMGFPPEFKYYPCEEMKEKDIIIGINCPNAQSMDAQKYFFPWYIRNDFLRDNLTWTTYLGIDLQHYKVNDMWFDFTNLLLLSLYFFKFGNQSKVLSQSKVSFSKTSRLEQILKLYSHMQKKKKEDLVGRLAADTAANQSQVADPLGILGKKEVSYKKEEFLGPTFYLQKLKKKIFIYNFTKKMQIFSYVGVQVMTAIVILTLAILHRSLMSIGYIILCFVLLMHLKDFFYQDKLGNKQWVNPYIFERPLLIYCFLDVTFQILYQYPDLPPQIGTHTRYLGFDKIYQDFGLTSIEQLIPVNGVQAWVTALELQNMFFFMVKALNLFFIFLQTSIYKSDGFPKFQRGNLRHLLMMGANYKRMIITYIYNNRKLQDIIRVQQKKKHMHDQLEELKDEVRIFQRQQKSLLWGLFQRKGEEPTEAKQSSISDSNKTSLIRKNNMIQDNEFQPEFFRKDLTEKQLARKPKTVDEKLLEQKSSVLEELNTNFDMEKLHVLNEDDPNYEIKHKLFTKATSKLGTLARLYMWVNESYVNQVFFIESVDEATRVKDECSKGILKSSNDLKNAMKRDIDLIVAARLSSKEKKKIKKGQEYQIKLEDMPETSEFIKFNRISVALIESIPKALLSQAAALSYLFMILSMILNAGLISIVYPFAVFGYALMEEGRPQSWFWRAMSYYTIFIMVMKFIVQLDIWYMLGLEQAYYSANSYMILGLDRVEGILALALYLMPEFLVLSCVWAQIFYEILAGLHTDREIEVEDIQQARERFLGQFNQQAVKVMNMKTLHEDKAVQQQRIEEAKKALQKEAENAEEVGSDGQTQTQRAAFFVNELAKLRVKQIQRKPVELRAPKENEYLLDQTSLGNVPEVEPKAKDDAGFMIFENGERKNLKELIESFQEKADLNHSLIINEHQRKKTIKSIKEKKRSTSQRLVKSMGAYQYFRNLFPALKEQKPGVDMYASITFWQFIICFYLITYYTSLDARGTQNLETTNQYSFNMVIMLFVQVTVMIIERYISRTNTRINKRGEDVQQTLRNMNSKTMTSSQSQSSLNMTKTQHTKKGSVIAQALTSANPNDEYNKLKQYTELTVTKMTFQQVLKWIIQIILLIAYHVVIFWLFPLSSNDAIYGQPHCNREAEQTFNKYGCYDFKSNIALIVFYIIFCIYFMKSALQIRYGYPDWKDPSSLTSTYGLFPWLGNMIFYSLPFLLELKTVLDWCFTKTSLDVFQWLELGEINNQMFNATNGNPGLYKRKLGTRVSSFEKRLCGSICVSVMLFFLVGPFLFFSNLRYIASDNPVLDATLGVKITITDNRMDIPEVYEYPLYYTETPLSIYQMSENFFKNRQYDQRPETKFFDVSQVQTIRYKAQSDEVWSASTQYKLLFRDLIDQSINKTDIDVTAELNYEFFRTLPETAKKAYGAIKIKINTTDQDQMAQFQKIGSTDCYKNPNDIVTITLKNLIPTRVRLGETSTASALMIDDSRYNNVHNVDLEYSCQNYWMLNKYNEKEEVGIDLQVFSDIISEGFFSSTSILGFYLGAAFTIGTLFRTIVMYKTDRIFICDARDPTLIRNLIACIYRQRLEQNLKKEEELFFLLFEILRSPELFKHITGTSLRVDLEEEAAKAFAKKKEAEKKANAQKQTKLNQVPEHDEKDESDDHHHHQHQ